MNENAPLALNQQKVMIRKTRKIEIAGTAPTVSWVRPVSDGSMAKAPQLLLQEDYFLLDMLLYR